MWQIVYIISDETVISNFRLQFTYTENMGLQIISEHVPAYTVL